ncbi:MAG: hypothetical protein N4A46_02520 [Schleiferiaceae bacterium]|nr:hypothetical protein [Schleiferiaceae bacterium]
MKRGILLLFILMSIFSYGQELDQDTIYLKDGSVLVGEILKNYDDGSVKIESSFGVVIISGSDIDNGKNTPEKIQVSPTEFQDDNYSKSYYFEDVELRKHVEAYRRAEKSGYTLQAAGIGALVFGAILFSNDGTEEVGTALMVGGTALSIGGIITLWTSPKRLQLSSDGLNLKLNF